MKFGHVDTVELEHMHLELPEDNTDNRRILNDRNAKIAKVYVGCAKWGRSEWVGIIYPKGTRPADYLRNYVNHFNGIELNGTFYQTKKDYIKAWTTIPDNDFKFCPKFHRIISHIRRLNACEESTAWFFDAISAFGSLLGLPFLQMPDNFSPKYFERLQQYIRDVSGTIPYALELRHEAWFSEAVVREQLYRLLEEHNVTLIITDTAGRRDLLHQRLTTNKIFIRFVGYGLLESDFTRMDAWAEQIRCWIENGLSEAYFFLHQKDEKNSVVSARYMANKLNEVCGLNIKLPQFIKQSTDL